MKTIINTERLILKEFSLNDTKSMYQLNSDLDVLKYTGDKPFKSIEEAVLFIEKYNDLLVVHL